MRRPDGALAVDRHGAGRGAWLCEESPACLERAVRQHRFERAFRAPIGAAELEQLCAHLGAAWGSGAPDVRG